MIASILIFAVVIALDSPFMDPHSENMILIRVLETILSSIFIIENIL